MPASRATALQPGAAALGARQVAADYFALTKPKVQSLLLFTTIAAMETAGSPSAGRVALTCLGGYMSAGGAGAVNHWFDRDIDARMARTADRPVASGRVAPAAALAFGCALSALSFLLLSLTVNVPAAALALCGFLGYTLVYTVWLKRRTPQNIVIGGAAGAFPPVVGWAAVTGDIGLPSLLLFALIFFWTPPHFWALALYRAGDYEKAGVPMLPVVAGARETKKQMLAYTLVLWPVALAPTFLGLAGWLYGGIALLLSALFTAAAWRVWRDPGERAAKQMFAFSILYLFLLFALLLVDKVNAGGAS
jgi:heme o synthase